jgi:ABC-type phosphate transport system substrate-binding protein
VSGQAQRWCSLLVLALCSGVSCEARDLAVIVDKANSVDGMTAADLAKVFKLDTHKWPNGRKVILVLRDPSTREMRTVIEKIYRMPPGEVKTLIAARHADIVIVNSEEQMLKSVEAIPGAIGVVDVYSIGDRVKVLKVDAKLPLEPGYFLKLN